MGDVEQLVESTIKLPCEDEYSTYTEIRRVHRKQIDATCLRINKQFLSECSTILYGHNTFDCSYMTYDFRNQDMCNFYNALAVCAQYGGVVLGAEEGKNIAKAVGKNSKGAILMNHGLLTVGSTVDEAGFLFALLDHGCQIQSQVDAACACNPTLKKQIISDEEAAYNFKMASDPDTLYAEIQPDLDFIFETDGLEVVSRGVKGVIG